MTVDFTTFNKKGEKTEVEKKVPVGVNDKPADVAGNIAKAFGDPNVKANGDTVTFDPEAAKVAAGGFSIVANDAIKGKVNTEEEFGALLIPNPNQALAQFAFEPNPDNGQNTLVTDADVTAGFTNGLSPVSFTAPAGASLSMLASMLDSALKEGGYLTSMPDSTDVLVFGQGVSLPVEVDFSLDPLGTVGDLGIETALFTTVPEPSTLLLLSIGLAGLLGYGWRRPLLRMGLRRARFVAMLTSA